MTEQEAEAQEAEARLTRRLMSSGMDVMDAETLAARVRRLSGMDEGAGSYQLSNLNNLFQFQGPLHGNDFHVQLSSEIFAVMLFRGMEEETGYFYLNSLANEVQYLYCDGVTEATEADTQFVDQWLAFFRRCCWLLGANIDATAHEKVEWVQDFTREEDRSMEFEHVSEMMDEEARRVAAAFGIEEWDKCEYRFDGLYLQYTAEHEGMLIRCGFATRTGNMTTLDMKESDNFQSSCMLSRHKEDERVFWSCSLGSQFHKLHLLARSLYCFGFEDEGVLAQLPSLSAHEKLELRLSMPREFWPKTWLDEDAK